MDINHLIDHTLLRPTATEADIVALCAEAEKYKFHAVCVHGCHVALVKRTLGNSAVKIAAVAGFPLGAMSTQSKIHEAVDCIEHGADEIDVVINLGWLKSGNHEAVGKELRNLKEAIDGKILKVIVECCYLTQNELLTACRLVVSSGAEYIKTSTGFGPGGATPEDVKLIKKLVGDKVGIKASGGIRDRTTALKYIGLGVSRIGTSSGIAIVSAT